MRDNSKRLSTTVGPTRSAADPPMPKLSPDVQIVLVEGDAETTLTQDESEAVADAFDHIRISAGKYRAWTGHGGRLLVIDPEAIAEIRAFLATRSSRDT